MVTATVCLETKIAVPGLIDHLRVSDIAAAVVDESSQGMKRLWPEFQLAAISQQRRGCSVEPKRPERNLFHLAPSRYVPKSKLDALLTSVQRIISQNRA